MSGISLQKIDLIIKSSQVESPLWMRVAAPHRVIITPENSNVGIIGSSDTSPKTDPKAKSTQER